MKDYLLSIVIPTYNRVEFLIANIQSFVQEPEFSQIQFIISDNASVDDTKEQILSFVSLYSNIKYHQNEKNLGLEANTKIAIELADGEFIKTINDYTLINKHKLARLLSFINENRKEKPALFFLNKKINKLDTELTFSNLDEFVAKISYDSTWLSTFGIWKVDYEQIKDKGVHYGLLFYHTSILFRLISTKRKTIVLAEEIFSVREVSNKGGYHILVFIENYLNLILKDCLDAKMITRETFKTEKKRLLKFIYPYIVGTNIKKKYSFSNEGLYRTLFENYKKDIYFYYYATKYAVTYGVWFLLKPIMS